MSQSRPKTDDRRTDAQAAGLDTPVQFCPGVGPKRARIFEQLDVFMAGDLLWHLPRGYEDFHQRIPLSHVQEGQVVTVAGEVKSAESRPLSSRAKARHLIKAVVEDPTGSIQVTWFNQPYLTKLVGKGAQLVLHGKVERRDYLLQMSSPKVYAADDNNDTEPSAGILPLYPLVGGLTQGVMRKIMDKTLQKFLPQCDETLPQSVLQPHEFPARREAFRILHKPEPGEGAPVDTTTTQPTFFQAEEDSDECYNPLDAGDPSCPWERARTRLVFEEFFQYQLVLRAVSQSRKQKEGVAHPPPQPDPFAPGDCVLDPKDPQYWPALFVQNLSFELTPDQKTVCDEILADMTQPRPMNRLLQGDVGSGKTVVALFAMMAAVAGGYQAAMMAPTEILARQHMENLRRWTASIPGLNTVVLSGSATAAERREIYSLLQYGTVQIVIGTHALFQENVRFANLGLVVVDEQHKFGVMQRQRLVNKGRYPDILVATATPIPRTLSLTLFGDMDVSTIRTMPPGRPPLITRWTTPQNEKKLWQFVDEKIGQGQQVYVVCPIIKPSENSGNIPAAEEVCNQLTQEFLPKRRVALLHGRYSSEEKQALMEKMQAGGIDVVVATTVVEVGVDLPNATIMVIMGAERFGLSQLHQLRGRVGRGRLKSYCILFTAEQISPLAERRMRVLEHTCDGFQIAEEDLKLRGPGEQFGTRQSGHLRFRVADPYRDVELLQQARETAHQTYDRDPQLVAPEHQPLKAELRRHYGHYGLHRPS